MLSRRPARNVETVVASLKRLASKRTRDDMPRYGIPSDKALGVPMRALRSIARRSARLKSDAASVSRRMAAARKSKSGSV